MRVRRGVYCTVARPARPNLAATSVATQAASAADSRCDHHGAWHALILCQSLPRKRKDVQVQGTLTPRQVGRRVLSAASHGESPPFVRRRPAISRRRVPKTARPLHSSRVRRSVFIRVPRLAQQGDDLALALLPCVVDGRPAVPGSKRRIGAHFEKALDDREVAVACRVMQC